MGKRTKLEEYRVQGRGGYGVKTMNITSRTGKLIGSRVAHKDDRILLMTSNGLVMKFPVRDVRPTGRSTQGVRIVRLDEGQTLVAVARIPSMEEAEFAVAGKEAKAQPAAAGKASAKPLI